MKKFKIFVLLNFILIFVSCGTVQNGFSNKNKNSSDEFLVEKKSPLVMPPDYEELPKPKNAETVSNSEDNTIKSLISNKENQNKNLEAENDFSKTLEESFLKKIKNN